MKEVLDRLGRQIRGRWSPSLLRLQVGVKMVKLRVRCFATREGKIREYAT